MALKSVQHYRGKFESEHAVCVHALAQARNYRRAIVAVSLVFAVALGSWFNSPAKVERPQAQPPAAELLKPMAAADEGQPIGPALPVLGCVDCQPPAATEPHILASLKMFNRPLACSATVIGDSATFRQRSHVAIITAAHCVTGNIGAQAEFCNPDGKTKFQATLVAFDRTLDAALFETESRNPLAAVLMADPEGWDQRATFSSCNFPASSGGPNYKFCKYAGIAYRDGAEPGNLFTIDGTSREHGGYFNSGGSGGGLFVQPHGSATWYFCSATTHGGNGTSIATPKCKRLFDWIRRHIPDRCGPWGCRPPQQPGQPTPPKEPDEDKPDWFKPNIPIETPPVKPLPNPSPDDTASPSPTEGIKDGEERIKALEDLYNSLKDRKPEAGPAGPAGPPGTPGTNGTNGKDAPPIDMEKIRLEANAAARAEVQAMIVSGGLRGTDGKPWSPVGASEAELQAIIEALPPIRFTLIKDGKEFPLEQKLGPKQEFRLRFTGTQKTVVAK